MPQLVVPSFGGGVVLQGSPDTKKTDELQSCDSFDLGERGQLVASGTPEAYTLVKTGTYTRVYAVLPAKGQTGDAVVIGSTGAAERLVEVRRTGDTDLTADVTPAFASADVAQGCYVTVASVPYVAATGSFTPTNPVLVNFGTRENGPQPSGLGLYAYGIEGSPATLQLRPIQDFDGLGTGQYSEGFSGGTKGKQLYFRGIAGYNNHIFGWGYDSRPASGDSPNRLSFSNVGQPLKWGNDKGAAGDRDYTDSDAITIGAAGDIIRGCYAWNGKLYIGTDKELHYLQGYGRQSFITDGSNAVARENINGPHCMIEGPDALLYGVGSNGLWVFDGQSMDVVGRRLVTFGGQSNGWWDLIWSDPTATLLAYPGRTNQDLVWMMSDRASKSVWVVIPFCNATLGYGAGSDTVIIKYNVLTGGFSRHVLANTQYTAGCYLPQSASGPEVRFVGGIVGGQSVVRRYGFRTTATTPQTIAAPLPSATFGPYAPYGPHGTGVHRVTYLTLAWESAASLPLVFTVTPSVDDQAGSAIKVSIQPTTPSLPSDGDYWLDTSATDTNTGNATSSTLTPASADWVWKTYSSSRASWIILPHGGQKGTRATLRLAYRAMRGTRVSLAYATTSAAGRFQIESLGLEPAAAREAA